MHYHLVSTKIMIIGRKIEYLKNSSNNSLEFFNTVYKCLICYRIERYMAAIGICYITSTS